MNPKKKQKENETKIYKKKPNKKHENDRRIQMKTNTPKEPEKNAKKTKKM